MDELDIEILKILIKDARTPFNKIGKMLGVSKDRVKRRYERIKQRNPNLKSTVVLDTEKMGFKTGIGFRVKTLESVDPQKIKVELQKKKKIIGFSEAVGDFDFYVDVLVVDYDELHEIYDYLGQTEGIESLDIFFYNIKIENFPFMSERYIYSMK